MRIFRGIRWRWVRPVAAGGLFCVAALIAAQWAWQSETVDGWLHAQIVALPDDEVEPWLLGYSDSRSDAAMSALVLDLTAERDAVRKAAERVLLREVDRWGTLPDEEVASRAVAVGEALRRLPRRKSLPGAEAVVARLDAWSRTWACSDPVRERLSVLLHGLPRRTHVVADASPFEEEPRPLPKASPPMPPVVVVVPEIVPASATTAEPARLAVEPPTVSANATANVAEEPASPPEIFPPSVGDAKPLRSPEWDLAPRPKVSRESKQRDRKMAPEPPLSREAAQLMSTRELFRALNGAERSTAEVELRSRGFRDEHLELARHLSATDVEERRAWTEALPRVSGIEARVWLAWMTKDSDTSVRRSAVTLLLTMPDEAARSLLREIAVSDPDPTVRRLAAARGNRP